jgi:hypothetical protein
MRERVRESVREGERERETFMFLGGYEMMQREREMFAL